MLTLIRIYQAYMALRRLSKEITEACSELFALLQGCSLPSHIFVPLFLWILIL